MASSPIDSYLRQIENAVYGRDVRGAIVASIEQCYDDVTAGVTKADGAAFNAQIQAQAAQYATVDANAAADRWNGSQDAVDLKINSLDSRLTRAEDVASSVVTARDAANAVVTAWNNTYKSQITTATNAATSAADTMERLATEWNSDLHPAVTTATNAANTAAGRAEAVADMQDDISDALNAMRDATNAANTATGQLEDALSNASTAVGQANAANNTAIAANNTASSALTAANLAQQTAANELAEAQAANTTAGNALTAAQQALRDANAAIEAANTAANNAGSQADEAERWAGLAETATNQANLVAAQYDNIISAISSANTQASRAETQAGLAETAAGRANTAADSIQSGMTDIANLKIEYSNQLAALAEAINSANEAASDASASAEAASDGAREANEATGDARELINDLSSAATTANNAATAAQTATSEAQAEIDRLSGMIDEVSTNSIAAHDNAEAAAAAASECRTAKTEADTARDAANTAADRADSAAEAIENLEVSSESVASNIDAEATVYDVEGNKHIHFKLKQGEPGSPFIIKGDAYATLSDLEADIVDPMVGDQYNVGSGVPYNVYRWTGTTWEDQGPIGVQNEAITKPDIDTIFGGLEIESAARKYLNGTSLDYMIKQKLKPSIDRKVDAVTGKGLSTNDFTTSYKNKVDANAQQIAALSSGKVDAVEGYGLSQVNFSTTYRDTLVSASNAVANKLDANKIRDSLDITEKGYVLDASRGKELNDAISAKLDANKVVNDYVAASDKALSAAKGAELKTLVDGKIDSSKIANNFDTTTTGFVLDASRGKWLYDEVNTKLGANMIANNVTTNLDTMALSASMGVKLAGDIAAITPSKIGAIPSTSFSAIGYKITGPIYVKLDDETKTSTTLLSWLDNNSINRYQIYADRSNGYNKIYMQGRSDGGNVTFGVGCGSNGEAKYYISHPAAFRRDIELTETFYNGLDKQSAGFALDARQGRELKSQIDSKISTSAIKNALNITTTGFVLDAYQGKVLDDKISGKVSKSGDSLTGHFVFNAGYDATVKPSATKSSWMLVQNSSNGRNMAGVYTLHSDSGYRYVMLRAGDPTTTDNSNGVSIGAGYDVDGNPGYFVTSQSAFRKAIGFNASDALPLARGGTAVSLTSAPSMLVQLGSETADTLFKTSPRPGITGILPLKHGGTGANLSSAPSVLVNLASSSASSIFTATPRPGVYGTLAISNGGTGATSVAGIRSNLGFKSSSVGGNTSRIVNLPNSSKALIVIGGSNKATHTLLIASCDSGGDVTYSAITQGSMVTVSVTDKANQLKIECTSTATIGVIPFDALSTVPSIT